MRRCALLLVLLTSTRLYAQQLPALNLDRLSFVPSLHGSLTVGNGEISDSGSWRAAVIGQYASRLAVVRGPSPSLELDRTYATALLAYGITSWLEVGGQIPVVLNQGSLDWARFRAPSASALAPLVVTLRAALVRPERSIFSVAIEGGAVVPFGAADALVAPAVARPMPFVRVSGGLDLGRLRLFAELNALEHYDTSLEGVRLNANDWVTDELGGGAGLSVELVKGLSVEAAGILEYDIEHPGWTTQTHVGARWAASPTITLLAAGGPAFGTLIGTPEWRAFGGILFTFDRAPAEQKKTPDVAGTPLASTSGGSTTTTTPKTDPCTQPNADPSACPDADLDSDGIANRADQCVSQGEDKDGFNDTDGCPETDNDGDSIADASDKCPNEAGVPRFSGCPIPDADKDGIADADDACPNEYGMVAARGCAVKDADGDSFADAKDACPTKAGIAELKGCPAADRDADGVFDHMDNCPRERGLTDNGGCPARKKQLVLITPDSLELRDKVFFVAKKARIQPRSNKLLKQVATVLKQAKHIEQVRIEVHGDDDLNADKNRKLTQDRADAVRAMLVKAGIAPDRLVAVGMGNDKPLDPKRTFKAKATNRRVEFHIVQPETPATM